MLNSIVPITTQRSRLTIWSSVNLINGIVYLLFLEWPNRCLTAAQRYSNTGARRGTAARLGQILLFVQCHSSSRRKYWNIGLGPLNVRRGDRSGKTLQN